MRQLFFESLDSTSLHARREITAGRISPDDAAVCWVAQEQTGGIGRFGRPWHSPRGGLWMTLACATDLVPEALGLRIGVECTKFVRSLAPEARRSRVLLKWPNDVLVDDKKVCGTLCERLTVRENASSPQSSWLLIGVGLNANFSVDALPEPLRQTAATLRDWLGTDLDLKAAADDLQARLVSALHRPTALAQAVSEARGMLAGVGRAGVVTLPDGTREIATLLGLDDQGHAQVRTGRSEFSLPGGQLDWDRHLGP